MVHSMTAFARKEHKAPWGTLSWELRSVNHRYLEISPRLPDTLRVKADANLDTRAVGLYETKVYTAAVHVDGEFVNRDFASLLVVKEGREVKWNEARLLVLNSESRSLRAVDDLWVAGESGRVAADAYAGLAGISTPVPEAALRGAASIPFRLKLTLAGSSSLNFLPLARKADVAFQLEALPSLGVRAAVDTGQDTRPGHHPGEGVGGQVGVDHPPPPVSRGPHVQVGDGHGRTAFGERGATEVADQPPRLAGLDVCRILDELGCGGAHPPNRRRDDARPDTGSMRQHVSQDLYETLGVPRDALVGREAGEHRHQHPHRLAELPRPAHMGRPVPRAQPRPVRRRPRSASAPQNA